MATGARSELINVLGEVKARVQDKLGIVDFPMPQFILIGKQSVGKSRLCEALAGETFNFISGTLGSRRPTVLEFRNVASATISRWYVRDFKTNQWQQMDVAKVMQVVGDAHNSLGADVTEEPVYVRLESTNSVDMQIVDLPGFRDFSLDAERTQLAAKIETLVTKFMQVKNNVMLCVEQASDAATMSTLGRCRDIDPKFERTILIRNKLDKYYSDLTPDNVNKWVDGFGDLPSNLMRFSLTLPWWTDGSEIPKPFHELRKDMETEDLAQMGAKGLSKKFLRTIGFGNFQAFMENKIEQMFAAAIDPVLTNLRNMQKETSKNALNIENEYVETDPNRILSTTRDCGQSFATALTHVMEGVLTLTQGRMTLEAELRQFHAFHESLGAREFELLPTEDMCGLPEYVEYLRNEVKVGAFDVEINGGAQFRRLMSEVEIYLRFSEVAVETKKRDVIQARGVNMSSLTWRDVVVKLLRNEAHLPLQKRLLYVAERLKWFFEQQKDAVLEFMESLEGTPSENLFSPLYVDHVNLMKRSPLIKDLVYRTYDDACKKALVEFTHLFENMLTSIFSNPWVFLKGATPNTGESEDLCDAVLPSFDDTKQRIPVEITSRSGIETVLSKKLNEIPTDPNEIDEAVDKVQQLVLKTYGFIRSQVCDQVELFAESFFKLPMLRRLEEDMSLIELTEENKMNYEARRSTLKGELESSNTALKEINFCVDRLNSFKLQIDAKFV